MKKQNDITKIGVAFAFESTEDSENFLKWMSENPNASPEEVTAYAKSHGASSGTLLKDAALEAAIKLQHSSNDKIN